MDNNNQLIYDKLINLVKYKKGKKPNVLVGDNQPGFLPYIDIEAFEKGLINRYTDDKSSPLADENKDILVVWDGARAGLVGKASGAVGSTLMRVTPLNINRDYLLFFLQSKYREINTNHRGTGIPHVNPDIFWEFEVPLPAISEQLAIVKNLNEILPDIEKNRNKISNAKKNIQKFKKSIITAAVNGKLTEDWRKEKNIISEWEKVKLSEVATSRLGKMLDVAKNQGNLTPYLRNTNVRWFSFNLDDIKQIRVTAEEAISLRVRDGDILVCEGGDPGRSAIWQGKNDTYIYQKALHCVRVGEKLIPEWVCFCLKSASDTGSLENYFTGSTIKHLTGVSLKRFELSLPSLDEQKEIARKVTSLFSYAEKVEKQIEKAEHKVVALNQSILKKVFSFESI